MLAFSAFSGFSQNADVKELLDKPETRTEIFNTILENPEFMMEFMKSMKSNEHAMMMMKEGGKMKGLDAKVAMKGDHQMTGTNMEMCSKMASMMAENPEMKQMMEQKMKQKGMINKDCCSQMTKKKGETQQEHEH